MPRTHFCYECDHDVEADHEHTSPNFDPVVVSLEDMARWETEHKGRAVCPSRPSCRWLAGLYPRNGPFFTDHAGWHEAGSHAMVHTDDAAVPSCTCGASTYLGDNNGAFLHLAEDEQVIVCLDSGQRIGYFGMALEPHAANGSTERTTHVEVSLTQHEHDLVAVAAADSDMAVDAWIREAAMLVARRSGPTLAAIHD